MDLRKCKFENTTAVDVDFTEANLSNLQHIDLSGATFFRTNIEKANFTTAKNYLINPSENQIKGAIFSMPDAINLLYSFGIEIQY